MAAAQDAPHDAAIQAITSQLRERGVSDPDARGLAEQLVPDFERLGRAARASFLDGVAAGWYACAETRARLDQTVSEIKEVERLMGAFTGELSKLDEVVEVLAAYVRRMRTPTKVETSEGQIVH
jgi:hypothetical protein